MSEIYAYNSTTARQLRHLREEKGMSQEEVAEAVGISRSTLGKYENGDNCPKSIALKDLAVFYGVSVGFITGAEKERGTDLSVRAMSKYLGLSEEAIEALHNSITVSRNSFFNYVPEMLNRLITDGNFRRVAVRFNSMLRANKWLVENDRDTTSDDLVVEDLSEFEDLMNEKYHLLTRVLIDDEYLEFLRQAVISSFQDCINSILSNESKTIAINMAEEEGEQRAAAEKQKRKEKKKK